LLKFALRTALLLFASTVTMAATELDGIAMPDTQDVAGVHFVLNGVALRTHSFLRIHIYVVGLYLERRSADADAILGSSQPKLLRFVFERHVEAEDARQSWRESLDMNCRPPCRLPVVLTDRFLAAVPSVQKGDIGALLFTAQGLNVFMNEQLLGRVSDPDFVRVILSTFIGTHPTSADLKRGLLGTAP
jgi:hypothetical protein